MKRKKPSFDESYYGYRSFTHLLEDADNLGLSISSEIPRAAPTSSPGSASEAPARAINGLRDGPRGTRTRTDDTSRHPEQGDCATMARVTMKRAGPGDGAARGSLGNTGH